MENDITLTGKAQLIASFTEKHLLDLIIDSGDVAADCLRASRYLGEYTYGMAFWENKINYFKRLEGQSILNRVTYAQNDLRFLLGDMEVRCHRVHPDTYVPLGAKKLKTETLEAGGLLLPEIKDYIISTSSRTPFIGIVADKKEGVQKVIIGLLFMNGKKPQCLPLEEVFNVDRLAVDIDVAEVAPQPKTKKLATRDIRKKVASSEE